MCASCHSTDVRKGYDAASDHYATRYHQIDVGCQACHGPASRHLDWARDAARAAAGGTGGTGTAPPQRAGSLAKGLVVDLSASSRTQVENCAQCHSLRSTLAAAYRFDGRLLDTYLPVTLGGPEYFADGQQREEVFVHGSWLQSRMHQKGLRCTDCHDAHTSKLKAPGNAVCTSCHNASAAAAGPHVETAGMQRKDYDSPAHHHHRAGTACVDCHAPKRTYMVVDPRLDHSFRIPRPDLSAATGSPDACTGCHANRDARWAADAVERWYGADRRGTLHYGQAFAAASRGAPGAASQLQQVAGDAGQPAFVRAGAIEQLARFPSRESARLIERALDDEDPQVRVAALRAAESLGPSALRALVPRLADAVRAVRIEAARVLAPAQAKLGADRAAWEAAAAELEAALRENADRPQAWLGLAALAQARGDAAGAEQALRRAGSLEPAFVPAAVNLADLLRQAGREPEAEALLREASTASPNQPEIDEALALALVRQGRKAEALQLLARAHRRDNATPRIAYLYAAALGDAGRPREAIQVLEASDRRQGDRDVLLGLAGFRRDAGDSAGERAALARLAQINPGDPALRGGAR
jgi:predicted CXXCH cytochrome family protein